MKSIGKYIIEKILISKDTNMWVDIDSFTEKDFCDAVKQYMPFEYEDILMATNGEPLYIHNRKVLSIFVDNNKLKYTYKESHGIELKDNLSFNDMNEKTIEQLYNYLKNNI